MVERKRRDVSRAAIGWLSLLGAYVGCHPDFDALSSGSNEAGSSGAGTGGAMAGSAGAGGANGGTPDTAGEGGESAGVGGTGTSGTSTGGRGGSGADAGSSGESGEGGDEGGTGTGGTSMAGKGGNAGAGGAVVNGGAGAGGAGAGGAGAGGGGAGGAGTGGSGGQAGACMEGMAGMAGTVTASGVEVLTVPLMAVNDGQRFNVQNRTSPSMPFDMSGATLTVRAYAPCAIGGNLSIFFRSTSGTDSPSMKVGLSTLVDAFVDIAVPVPAATGNFDPVLVDIIRIEVEADAAFGSTFRSPATIVYIDGVSSSNGAVSHPFDTMPTFLDFGDSGFRPLAGSTNVWRAQYP